MTIVRGSRRWWWGVLPRLVVASAAPVAGLARPITHGGVRATIGLDEPSGPGETPSAAADDAKGSMAAATSPAGHAGAPAARGRVADAATHEPHAPRHRPPATEPVAPVA